MTPLRLIAPLLGLLLALAAAPAAAQQTLRIGVEGAYPPFSSVGPDGQIKGFDIDIARALCAEMKVRCELVQQSFDGLIPSLNARKFDAVVASMSITPERQRAVLFTDKYYHTPAVLVARSGSLKDTAAATLKGKRIGVQRTTTHDRYATDKLKDSSIVRYVKQDDVFLDLTAGRLDAALLDSVAASEHFLKTPAGKGYGIVGAPITDATYFGVGAGIALRRGDTALRDRFNAAIKALRADGRYKAIASKYFDFDVYGQ